MADVRSNTLENRMAAAPRLRSVIYIEVSDRDASMKGVHPQLR
ncbi:hypothetical protein BSU04_39535 [Caballeronia sordidicola]|uniref:Uncharacterized protein n=1 Tax=Caballeronia sordidicola TaxID=196367 RepID=A0A226WNF7_CABSO|nr:hypothetical protein BSU04_39535 [Caballeronia sordidicola]